MSSDFRCTYRLQLGPGLGLPRGARARALLADLGVSHLYLPPSFQAREGSTHGYDVVDPTSISSELGRRRRRSARWSAGRARPGLGVILDIVPNHMATDDANRYWTDPSSRERFFDVDADSDPAQPFYRRFFDIDHLAGVRQEDPQVFEETHRLAIALVRDGLVDGLRIDHPDGMADPAGYLQRLADAGVEHIWVEKILSAESHPPEQLRRDWPVDGTVGYEFLNDVCALFVDPAARRRSPRWTRGRSRAGRRGQARAGDDDVLARGRLAGPHPAGRGHRAQARVAARVPHVRRRRSAEDREALEHAGLPDLYDDRSQEWITRFQQTSPPVMAKGVEDTAFYRYVRLLALNDVGGDPSRFGITVDRFHSRTSSAPSAIRATCSSPRRTTRSARATSRRGIGALSTLADEYVALARGWLRSEATARRPSTSSSSSSRRCSARTRSRRTACAATSRRRCARPSSRRTGSSRRRARAPRRRLRPRGAVVPRFAASPRRSPRPATARRWASAAQAHRPRRPRPLPGRRARHALARRPRQPPRGRLAEAARVCCKTLKGVRPQLGGYERSSGERAWRTLADRSARWRCAASRPMRSPSRTSRWRPPGRVRFVRGTRCSASRCCARLA
jgi:hypothetical protein